MEKKLLSSMEKKNKVPHFSISGFIILPVLVTIAVCLAACYFLFVFSKQTPAKNSDSFSRNYHIIVTGSSDTELFLKQVYDGASKLGASYNAVVELYVPGSQAEDVSPQSLFDYASFVNADCVIAYIDSTSSGISVPRRMDDTIIPLVTTGLYDPNLPQISFIGNSYWELGKKFSDETVKYLNDRGQAFIIGKDVFSASSLSSLVNSIQDSLLAHENISYSISDTISPAQLTDNLINNAVLFICLTEEDTIALAQMIIELKLTDIKRFGIIGFGNNETCQLYLSKGIIDELISLDPEKIGETAVREFFEYRNKGHANSYIAADVKITETMNRSNR